MENQQKNQENRLLIPRDNEQRRWERLERRNRIVSPYNYNMLSEPQAYSRYAQYLVTSGVSLTIAEAFFKRTRHPDDS